ncbi:hypothetical protein D3C76_1315990 [compost metagenome]
MGFQSAACVQGNAVLAQRLGDMRGNLCVFHRQDAFGHFHHADFTAQCTIEAGELDADGPGADHQQASGQGGWLQRFAVRPEADTVRFEPRQLPRPRTGGEDDVWRCQRQRVIVAGHLQRVLSRQTGMAVYHRDAVLLHQVLDATLQLPGHRTGACDHGG